MQRIRVCKGASGGRHQRRLRTTHNWNKGLTAWTSQLGTRAVHDKIDTTYQRDPNQYVTFVADTIGSSVSAANIIA